MHTGSTGGPILMIYTSYDVLPYKNVPFGVALWAKSLRPNFEA